MAENNVLKLDDIRAVFRIVQEAIDQGGDAVAWRQRMLTQVCSLIDAWWGTAFVIPIQFNPENLEPPVFAFNDMPQAALKKLAAIFRMAQVNDDPVTTVVASLSDRPVTLLRREMVSDKAYYNSGAYKRWREPLGMDDFIHSHDPLPQFGVMTIFGFARKRGEKPFTIREKQIVDLLREELKHRWNSAAATVSSDKPLTARQQQLLTHLGGTLSEKQIAIYMGLSPHTTHNYIKALYRRFNVTSRAELIALRAANHHDTPSPRIGHGRY